MALDRWFLFTVRDTTDNSTWYYMEPTKLSQDDAYITTYPWIVDGVLCSIAPFLLLLILNARLIWEVRKSTQYIQVLHPGPLCSNII